MHRGQRQDPQPLANRTAPHEINDQRRHERIDAVDVDVAFRDREATDLPGVDGEIEGAIGEMSRPARLHEIRLTLEVGYRAVRVGKREINLTTLRHVTEVLRPCHQVQRTFGHVATVHAAGDPLAGGGRELDRPQGVQSIRGCIGPRRVDVEPKAVGSKREEAGAFTREPRLDKEEVVDAQDLQRIQHGSPQRQAVEGDWLIPGFRIDDPRATREIEVDPRKGSVAGYQRGDVAVDLGVHASVCGERRSRGRDGGRVEVGECGRERENAGNVGVVRGRGELHGAAVEGQDQVELRRDAGGSPRGGRVQTGREPFGAGDPVFDPDCRLSDAHATQVIERRALRRRLAQGCEQQLEHVPLRRHLAKVRA